MIATYTLDISGYTVTAAYCGDAPIERGDYVTGWHNSPTGERILISGKVSEVLECEIHSFDQL